MRVQSLYAVPLGKLLHVASRRLGVHWVGAAVLVKDKVRKPISRLLLAQLSQENRYTWRYIHSPCLAAFGRVHVDPFGGRVAEVSGYGNLLCVQVNVFPF